MIFLIRCCVKDVALPFACALDGDGPVAPRPIDGIGVCLLTAFFPFFPFPSLTPSRSHCPWLRLFCVENFLMTTSLKPAVNGRPRFTPGQIVATPGALAVMDEHGVSPLSLLGRHLLCDWGTVPAADAALNDQALLDSNRILSSYVLAPKVVVWVITEWDRSATTFLLPSEY
jgi:hypothetical protein